jgi:hypothetical protein
MGEKHPYVGARRQEQAPEAPALGLWALGALTAAQRCGVLKFYVFKLRECF